MSTASRSILITTAILAALAVGYNFGQQIPLTHPPAATAPVAATDKGTILYYRNAMGAPDTSPIPKKDEMGMDYVPVYDGGAQAEPGTVSINKERIQKLGVRTEIVGKRILSHPVHAVGTVQIDETRQTIVAPRFEGWIRKLYVDASGQQVKKGDPLFDFYSPKLIEVETEYLSFAEDIVKGSKNGSLERLRTLGVPEEEIARLQQEKKANPAVILRAAADGTVMDKQAIEGMKFSSGDMLYRLADLSNVWVMADVYEQDLARLSLGQAAKISISAFPGETFEGKVGFVYPTINKETRTEKVRIDLPNPKGLLSTDMYADVEIDAAAGQGVVAVPNSALLNSGELQVVLVQRGEGLFQPHPVKTGGQGEGYTEILDGVAEGDKVVTSANFLIDAESNLRAALQSFSAPDNGAKQ